MYVCIYVYILICIYVCIWMVTIQSEGSPSKTVTPNESVMIVMGVCQHI